jgi:hypothetical protein
VHLSCPPYEPNTPSISFIWFTWWWVVQIIKLIVMQSSPLPCYFLSLRPKYLLQHSILKHTPQYERPSFTPIQITGKIMFLCMLISIFLDSKQEDKRFCAEW